MSLRRVIVTCAIVGFGALATAPTWAATYPPTGPAPTASVKGTEISRPVVQQNHGSLPFTGADIAAVTAAGVVAVAAGAVAVTAARRRGGKHT